MKVVCSAKVVHHRGAADARDDIDSEHLQRYTDSMMNDCHEDTTPKVVSEHTEHGFSPGARTVDEQAEQLLLHDKAYEAFQEASANLSGSEVCVLPIKTVLAAQSSKWTNLLKLPKCVTVSTNCEAVTRRNMFDALFSSSIGFAHIPWRTRLHNLSYMQRVIALYHLVPPSETTRNVRLDIPERWLRALTLKGKRVTPYRVALNIKDQPNLQFLSCVTGFGKTITAVLIGLCDVCLPQLWSKAQAECGRRVFERRRVPQSNFFEGGDSCEQRVARAILIVAPVHLHSQWEDAIVDMAHGMLAQTSALRICLLREKFDMSIMLAASAEYVFVVLASPTVELSERLRKHPDIHFVSRFDDELATPPCDESAGGSGKINTSLIRRFRVMETVAVMRHMLLNATFDSLAKACRMKYHPVREQLTPGGTGGDLPTHERLARAVCKAQSAVVEMHLDQFARLYLMSIPPSFTVACRDDALAQMCENFLVQRVLCRAGTLEGRLSGSSETDMLSLPLTEVLRHLFAEISVPSHFEHYIDNASSGLSDAPTPSEICDVVHDIHDDIMASIPISSLNIEQRSKMLSQINRLADRLTNLLDNDIECEICCEALTPPTPVVVMRCCTNMVCTECAALYNPCPFCRAQDPSFSSNLNHILHRTAAVASVNPIVDTYDTRMKELCDRRTSFFRASVGIIDALMLDNPSARLLIGLHNRKAHTMTNLLNKLKASFPTACIESMERFKDMDVDLVKDLRVRFNDCQLDPRPFIWVIDSQLASDTVAGMDLPATHAVLMTTTMSTAAQWQLAGRAVRRTPRHLLPNGEVRPRDKRLIMLSL